MLLQDTRVRVILAKHRYILGTYLLSSITTYHHLTPSIAKIGDILSTIDDLSSMIELDGGSEVPPSTYYCLPLSLHPTPAWLHS